MSAKQGKNINQIKSVEIAPKRVETANNHEEENLEKGKETDREKEPYYPLEEYKILREEIKEKISAINSISIQMIVSVAGLVGLGIDKNIRVLFPVASFLALIMYMRILYYNKAIARISAYMIVHLETKMDIWWETSYYDKNKEKLFENLLNTQKEKGEKKNKEFQNIQDIQEELNGNRCSNILGFIEPLYLQILCIGLWITFSVRNRLLMFCKNWVVLAQVVCLMVCIIIACILTAQDRKYHNGKKGFWINIWEVYFTENHKTKSSEAQKEVAK